MSKIDIVITWPTGCDYPMWRAFLRKNRERFNNVFISFHKGHSTLNFKNFLKEAMAEDNVTFVEGAIEMGDWRNTAINAALYKSDSEWVWFTEQDFCIENPGWFFPTVEGLMGTEDVLTFNEGERTHPACMFVRRTVINKTRKDFSVMPDISDHFGKFVAELAFMKDIKMGAIPGKAGVDFYHMNGLTHNYHLVSEGQVEHVFQPGLFQLYNTYARMQEVPMSDDWVKLSFQVDVLLSTSTIRHCFGR